jgi:hypothetical protein
MRDCSRVNGALEASRSSQGVPKSSYARLAFSAHTTSIGYPRLDLMPEFVWRISDKVKPVFWN